MPFFDLPLDQLKTYRSATPEPADFDAFWSATLEEARRFPLAPTFSPVDAGLPLVDVYDASFAGWGGHRISGWFIKPAGAKGPLPVVVKYVGYGGGRGFPHEQLFWAASGRAVLVMDTRGQGSGWSMGSTPDPAGSDPSQPGFMTRGILDRNAYYYRRIFTDAVRALDAARSRDDIDPARIAVAGGSQGGGISIAAAGLDSGVCAAMPDVPFLCHFRRAVGLTTRDPYGEIVRYLAMHRDKAEAAFTTLSYFDGVNFAARTKASGLFSVALMDDICPPSTVYAAYNAFAGPKAIRIYDFNNHEGGGAFQDREQLRWLATSGC